MATLPSGLAVFQLPGIQCLERGRRLQKADGRVEQVFPPGLEYHIVYDTTPFIRQSVDEVFKTLIDRGVSGALVVLFFLQDWKAMILPMIDVPVSLVGTFAVMALLGFSLNNLTLFGLVLAIGIVVDDAIVVLENIERLIATGLDARSATIKAMQEITGPIIAITLVLCSVFLPSAFMPGITGQFYRQFALTISVAMVISAINAMTLTPSRAVSIFQTEQVGAGHEFKREALPWWIFALLGGAIVVILHNHGFLGFVAPPAEDGAAIRSTADKVLAWLVSAGFFLAGAIPGGLVGWFDHRAAEPSSGPVLPGLQSNLRPDHRRVWLGRGAEWCAECLVVLVVYGGLLALTVWQMRRSLPDSCPPRTRATCW